MIMNYRQIMEVDQAGTLPSMAWPGDLAYADDTDRFYRYKSGTWGLVLNQSDIQALIDAKVPKTYVNGTQKTNQRLRWIDTTVVAGGGGNATFYITSDLTSGGTARATAIDLDSVSVRTEDNTGQYAFGAVTSPNIKTVIVSVFKQAFSGVVVLSLTVLGSVTNNAAPNGTVVKLQLDGDAA